jgi:hypothetical protein
MVIFKNDNIEISLIGKELYINYYRAGRWLAEIKTDNLYDYNLISVGLSK